MDISRRSFVFGAAAATAATGYSTLTADAVDENLSVFFSDIHISGVVKLANGTFQPTYQNPMLERQVERVLAMRPRPKRVVVFGDIALWHGRAEDYAASAPILKRLSDAGIEVTITTGNHDHRAELFAAYPRQREITPVPGRVTSVVNLGTADLFLLDTLNENPAGAPAANPVPGTLDKAQGDWLMAQAKAAKRPFFVGCHHPPRELSIGKKSIWQALAKVPQFAGFIHGHNHSWDPGWAQLDWRSHTVKRFVCLPSTGWWGTIGFTTFRTFADRAELALAPGNDFYFPRPLEAGEKRPAAWDDIVASEAGAKCIFRYPDRA